MPSIKYQITILLVCLVGLLGTVGCTLGGLYGVIALVEPDLLLPINYEWQWQQLKNDDHYWRRVGIISDYTRRGQK